MGCGVSPDRLTDDAHRGAVPGPTAPRDAAARPPHRDLGRDEARGGHTLARHVGLSDADLRARLAREPGIAAASSYVDRETAERTVGAVLDEAGPRIDRWARRTGRKANLALDFRGDGSRPIGHSLRRGERRSRACYDAVVVLKWDARRDDFFVLTSYPEARR